MSAEFEGIAARADAAVDRILGETIRIEPRLAPAYTGAGEVDPDRSVKTVAGWFRTVPEGDTLVGQSREKPIGLSLVAGRKTILHLSRAAAESLGYALAKGDRVTRIERPTDAAFEVADVSPADLGDVFVHLVVAS